MLLLLQNELHRHYKVEGLVVRKSPRLRFLPKADNATWYRGTNVIHWLGFSHTVG